MNRSLGGLTTYPFDSNGDGVADTCSLPRTRRAAIARQQTLEILAANNTHLFETCSPNNAERCRKPTGNPPRRPPTNAPPTGPNPPPPDPAQTQQRLTGGNITAGPARHPATLDSDPGCGAVWSAHLLWEQGVAGSNPASPTPPPNPQSATLIPHPPYRASDALDAVSRLARQTRSPLTRQPSPFAPAEPIPRNFAAMATRRHLIPTTAITVAGFRSLWPGLRRLRT